MWRTYRPSEAGVCPVSAAGLVSESEGQEPHRHVVILNQAAGRDTDVDDDDEVSEDEDFGEEQE